MKKYIISFFITLILLGFVSSETVKDLAGRKIVMIIAPSDFRDEEYQKPRELFEKKGLIVTVASSVLTVSKGMSGLEVKPDMLMEKINTSEFDGIVFIGGTGAREYWDNKTAHKIAKDSIKHKKVLGAICLAPVILARSGVLKNKRATCFGPVKDKIIESGAKYIGSLVEIDGNIITANGPLASETFAKDILEAILKNK
ncbi:MAG: DJ-1/PfpI family protein [bacterium]